MTMNDEIAARLKAIRESKGLSQKALAEICGWKSQSRIGNYELATRSVSADDAVTIANALGVSAAQLLFGGDGGLESEKTMTLSPQQKEILSILESLPDVEVNRFLAELRARKAHFDAVFEDMLKKRKGKAS